MCALLAAVFALASACAPAGEQPQVPAESTAAEAASGDSAIDTLIAGALDDSAIMARRRATQNARLSPLADSLARYLVFVPITQRWFAAASRGQRMLVDLGRVDTVVGDNALRQAAYREAVEKLAPIARGARLRLRGPWGSDDVVVSGFDVWSGRIVATLQAPAYVDSLARAQDWLPAVAVRSDSAAPRVLATCQRGEIPASLNARLNAVRDSVLQVMRAADDVPRISRLAQNLKSASSRIGGCFQNAAALLFVTLYAGDHEWVRERAFAIEAEGSVRALGIRDLRFKSHEVLAAFDADEDGDDDLAARGRTLNAGALVLLRLVEAPAGSGSAAVPGGRLERAATGFAWER